MKTWAMCCASGFVSIAIFIGIQSCTSTEKRIAKTVLDYASRLCPETDTVKQCAARIVDALPEKAGKDGGV